jgi:hypothetical protein
MESKRLILIFVLIGLVLLGFVVAQENSDTSSDVLQDGLSERDVSALKEDDFWKGVAYNNVSEIWSTLKEGTKDLTKKLTGGTGNLVSFKGKWLFGFTDWEGDKISISSNALVFFSILFLIFLIVLVFAKNHRKSVSVIFLLILFFFGLIFSFGLKNENVIFSLLGVLFWYIGTGILMRYKYSVTDSKIFFSPFSFGRELQKIRMLIYARYSDEPKPWISLIFFIIYPFLDLFPILNRILSILTFEAIGAGIFWRVLIVFLVLYFIPFIKPKYDEMKKRNQYYKEAQERIAGEEIMKAVAKA